LKLRIHMEAAEMPRSAANDAARVALGRTAASLERVSLTLSLLAEAYRCRVLLVTHNGIRAASEVSHPDGLEAVRRAASKAARRITFSTRQRATPAATTTPTKEQEREAS